MTYGLTIKHDQGGKRLEVKCPHQNGLIYITRSEGSWVCEEGYLHAHCLAGFFKGLTGLRNPDVKGLMNEWGIYFRELALDGEA